MEIRAEVFTIFNCAKVSTSSKLCLLEKKIERVKSVSLNEIELKEKT